MIISEKQIMQLMATVGDYIETLKMLYKTNGMRLSSTGQENLDNACYLMQTIQDQQSEELKEIK